MTMALAVTLALPAFAAAQGVKTPHAPIPTGPKDIAAMRMEYVNAFNAKDSKAISGMYTPDATMVEADGSHAEGMEAISAKNGADAMNWPQLTLTSESLKIYGTTAIDAGTWTTHSSSGDMSGRYLAVLRHDVNGWKLHDTAEVPAK
jgi:uncharacterized protein (TIGR02246 family)